MPYLINEVSSIKFINFGRISEVFLLLIYTKRYIALTLVLLIAPATLLQAQKKKKTDPVVTTGETKSREAEFYFTEAEKFFILEDFAKALVYYQKALDIKPESATIHYKIAEVLSRGEKQDELIRASLSIEQALKYEQKNKYFYLLGANINANLNRFDKAAQLYEGMMQQIPETDQYLYDLALIYQYSNKPTEALKTYQRVEEKFGINETASVNKQRILIEQGRVNEAIAEGEKLLLAFPEEESYAVGLAELLSQHNQSAKGIDILEKFIADYGKAPGASVLLAGLYRDVGREGDAKILVNKIFDDPSVEITSKLIVLGTYSAELSRNKSNKTADAEAELFVTGLYQKLSNEYPDDQNVQILGGDLYLTMGKNREAEKEYLKAIESGDVNFEVWQNTLYLQIQREAYAEVIKNSENALEYFPNQNMLYYFKGLAHLRKNQFKDAALTLEMGKRLANSNPAMVSEINGMLGDAYNGSKEYDKSDKAYDEALAFNPNNYVILNNYAYYLALRKASLDKAERMSALLIKNNPDNPTFLDTHAWVLYARLKFKDARKIMERVVSTSNANATHFEHYGDILFRLGEVNEAVVQWEKAKAMLQGDNELLNKKIANRKIYE